MGCVAWECAFVQNWNTGTVTDMREMFCEAQAFTCDLGEWNVSKVTTMRYMFLGAKAFDRAKHAPWYK